MPLPKVPGVQLRTVLRIKAVCNQVTKLKVTFMRNAVSLLHLGADNFVGMVSMNVSPAEIFQQQNTVP